MLELGDDRYVVLKLNKSIPARQKDLAEVKDAVVASSELIWPKAESCRQGAALLARVDAGEIS